jgi:5'-nucleotidase
MPNDVQVLKIEVPKEATPDTPWETTRLSNMRFYRPIAGDLNPETGITGIDYDLALDWDNNPPGTDSHTVVNKKLISVTPLSLDLTSRVDLSGLDKLLRED